MELAGLHGREKLSKYDVESVILLRRQIKAADAGQKKNVLYRKKKIDREVVIDMTEEQAREVQEDDRRYR